MLCWNTFGESLKGCEVTAFRRQGEFLVKVKLELTCPIKIINNFLYGRCLVSFSFDYNVKKKLNINAASNFTWISWFGTHTVIRGYPRCMIHVPQGLENRSPMFMNVESDCGVEQDASARRYRWMK